MSAQQTVNHFPQLAHIEIYCGIFRKSENDFVLVYADEASGALTAPDGLDFVGSVKLVGGVFRSKLQEELSDETIKALSANFVRHVSKLAGLDSPQRRQAPLWIAPPAQD